MYFPYLRGRQYELIGVREGLKSGIISNKIIPVIEPVKLSSTLLSTMKVAIEEEKYISIICNSNILSFSDDFQSTEKEKERNEYLKLLKNKFIIKAFLTKNDWQEAIDKYRDCLEFSESEEIIICNDANFINEYEKKYETVQPSYTLIPEEKRFRRKIKERKILFEDRFIREDRNSDYLNTEDDFFSEDHLYYEDDGYIGFSDYVTIGEKYVDGGFAPYAVAIHLTYVDEEDGSIRIRHFVSDSNEDIKDPAKKFYEALEKLHNFDFSNLSKTKALEMFYDYHRSGSYPGLGTVKKLSLLHHLELVKNILDSKED